MEVKSGKMAFRNFAIGMIFLLPLIAVNLFTSATAKNAWFFGTDFHIGCWFKDYFGVSCPVCGMTRSVILTMHGDLATAFQLNVGGPLLISGVALFGVLMIFSSFYSTKGSNVQINKIEKTIFFYTTAYLSVALIISLGFWVSRVLGYSSDI